MEKNLAIQNVLLANQTQILEQLNTINKVQNTILQKIASFSEKVGDATFQNNAETDSQVTDFLEVRNTSSTGAFYFKPIANVEKLNELENQLSEENFRQKLKNTFSVIRSEGKGVDCAYILSDVLFAREFLCQCSWSGGSRGNDTKVAWKSYKNILSFFVEMIRCWDKTYTMKQNELFFKNILKNALKRSLSKKLRASTSRMRTKRSKMQTANDETTDEDENTNFYENDHENDQNMVEEVNIDVDEEYETEAEINPIEIIVSNLRGPNEKEEYKVGNAIMEIKAEEHDVGKTAKDSQERINSKENTAKEAKIQAENESDTSFDSNCKVNKSNLKMKTAKLSKMKVENERHVKIKIISEEC